MEEKDKSIISTFSTLASISMLASLQFYFDEIGKPKYDFRPFTSLSSALLAVSSYCFARGLAANKISKSDSKKYLEALSRTTLDVKIDSKGQVASSVSMEPLKDNTTNEVEKPQASNQNVVVERRDGNTYYKIQNLNIYLTAEVVHQLNVNPNEVINTLKSEVRAELAKFEKDNNKST